MFKLIWTPNKLKLYYELNLFDPVVIFVVLYGKYNMHGNNNTFSYHAIHLRFVFFFVER